MKKGNRPYRGFSKSSLFSDPDGAKEKYYKTATFNRIVDTKTSIIHGKQSQIYKTLVRK